MITPIKYHNINMFECIASIRTIYSDNRYDYTQRALSGFINDRLNRFHRYIQQLDEKIFEGHLQNRIFSSDELRNSLFW